MPIILHYYFWRLSVRLMIVYNHQISSQILSVYHLLSKFTHSPLHQQNDSCFGILVMDVSFSLSGAELLVLRKAYLSHEYFAIWYVSEVGEGVLDGFGDAFNCALRGVDLEGG